MWSASPATYGSASTGLQADSQTTPAIRAQHGVRQKPAQEWPQMSESTLQTSSALPSIPRGIWDPGSLQAKTPLLYGYTHVEGRGQLPDGSLGTAHLFIGTGSLARTGLSLSDPLVLQLCSDRSFMDLVRLWVPYAL